MLETRPGKLKLQILERNVHNANFGQLFFMLLMKS